MNTQKLEDSLNRVLDNYYEELQTLNEYDSSPVSQGELAEYLKQTRYALEGLKKSIVSFLKES